jgi:nucleotide-binding universal stress UspA family protein
MEFIEGKDLRSFIRSGRPLGLDRTLGILDQLCNIVKYMHGQGVYHLDLKPENIFCCSNSRIKVIDFGLASCTHFPDLLSTDLQIPLGTPWYVAPEQLQGDRNDPRSDMYSMGILLYEMLTGRLPWARSNKLRVARRRLHFEPAPPRSIQKDIPPQIQSIILRAIARLPDKRYANIAAFQNDLKKWQKLPVTASGRTYRRLPLWKRYWPRRFISSKMQEVRSVVAFPRKQIIGAIIDTPDSDVMLAELKKQALIRSAEITLVHVIEEDDDSHVRRYGIIVEGEKFMCRLEGAVQLLRRCSLDPGIRLIRGEVVEVLRRLCADDSVELLVVAGSRKDDGGLWTGSVCKRLLKECPCRVVIAADKPFSPLNKQKSLIPDELTEAQVLAFDIFLVDIWYEQLHYYTDALYRKIIKVMASDIVDKKKCLLEQFLVALEHRKQWHKVSSMMIPVHKSFLSFEEKISDSQHANPETLQKLYLDDFLPLSCRLKVVLSEVSSVLHEHLESDISSVPFLTNSSCPVNMPSLSCYGPLLRTFDLGRDINVLMQRQKERGYQLEATETN